MALFAAPPYIKAALREDVVGVQGPGPFRMPLDGGVRKYGGQAVHARDGFQAVQYGQPLPLKVLLPTEA